MKARFLALAALVLGLASCQTEPEGLDVNVGGAVDTTITVSIPETETRYGENSNSAGSVFTNGVLGTEEDDVTMRYIFQVYYNNGDQIVESQAVPQVKYSDDKSVNFGVRLVPDRDYTFVVWADVVKKNDAGEWADWHYNTINDETNRIDLANITVIDNEWVAMDESRDAFTVAEPITNYTGKSIINLELKRPFAKLRVKTTDMKVLKDLQIKPTYATVEYTSDLYNTFNAVDGTVRGAMRVGQIGYEIAAYSDNDSEGDEQSMILFTDYVFAPKDQDGAVRFDLTVYDEYGTDDNVNRIKYNSFSTDIKTHRNYLTTISGNVLTDGNNINVKVEDAFAQPEIVEKIVEVGNATDLQKAINESTEETTIVLGGNINLGDLFGASIHSTRAAATLPIVIAEGKVVALDLNGFNLTTPFVEGSTTNHTYAFENHGSLTIQDSKGDGQIIARGIFNYGTMTLKSGTINACDGNGGYGVRNYEGAEFIMNGGSIVTSYEDGDIPGDGYDASPVRVDKGATATINGGAINNVSNFTVAIDNYGTTTINDGTFTTIHTTIANSASMTINGGSFTCNGLEGITAHALWAAAGTTTINGGTFDGKDNYNGFNVDASEGAIVNINGGKFLRVHSGSLYGEGTINVMGGEFFDNPSARVAEGYKVVENETGTYNVVEGDPVAKIGDVEYTTLQKAFDAVDNGSIQLVGNVTLKSSVVLNEGKVATLDLNGKTITATDYAIENFGTLKINGNGTINGVVYCEATGNTTVENGTFNALESGKYVFLNSQGGTLTINGGTINGGSSYPIYSYDANSSLVINDVTVNATFGCVNAYGTNGSVVINGGTYQMTGVQGKTSHIAYFSNVDATINGGTFKKTGDINMSAAGGGGICAIYGANLTINGGNFAGDYADVYNWSGTNANGRAVAISIKGGSYKFKPNAAFVAEGCEVTEANGVWNVRVLPVAQIGSVEYTSFDEAIAAAKAGDTITVLRDITLAEELEIPAGITFNGNGKQINGTIYAGGNLTFVGHTKVTAFSASYYDRVITIGEGACLEVTGTGRVSLAYGNTFNITGSLENAKTADKTNIQPSLIIPGGISITGGSDATMNVTNAYVQIGSTTSKNDTANGVFTLNFTNSIAEFTNQLIFAEPTSGKNPTFNLNIVNSVLTTGTKLIFAAPNCNTVIDNSNVTMATYFRNSGRLEVNNGSVVTGSTIQFGENGGNDGETIVDNSTFTITATSAGHALDGKGTGSINATNGATVTVDYYKGMTIDTDATSTFTGTEVQ